MVAPGGRGFGSNGGGGNDGAKWATQSFDSLAGLEALAVFVEGRLCRPEEFGVDAPAVQQFAASRLARAGLRVLTEADALDGKPYLYVKLGLLSAAPNGAPGLAAYRIDVQLFQRATLVRTPDAGSQWPTWAHEDLGLVGAALVPGTIIGVVTEMVDTFVSQWSQANQPK